MFGGTCWRPAEVESLFAFFKVEAFYAESVIIKMKAYSCVFEYIGTFLQQPTVAQVIGLQKPKDL